MPYLDHLYYEEAGAGQPVIFIHCPAVSHIYWRPVMDRLQSQARCIAFDIRGHGRSGLGNSPWTFADIGRDVIMLSRRLGLERPVLVGYSSGASIAMQAVLEEPGLFQGIVGVSAFSECCTVSMRVKVGLGTAFTRMGLSRFVGPNIIGTNSVGKTHTQAMLPDARRAKPKSLLCFFRETVTCSITHRLSEIQVPVLLVYGTADKWMHGYYRKLHQGLPNARAIFFPGVDHRVPTRKPDSFADAVAEFLAGLAHPEAVPLPHPAFTHPGAADYWLHR